MQKGMLFAWGERGCGPPASMKMLRRRTVSDLQAEARTDQRLHRALGPLSLTMLGIGAIIGGGIFVLTGTVAAQNAGPAVVLSFVLAGVASVFAALCYSEFASLVPMAGSAYTYAYATLGELFAWIIGWDLILEYAVGAITVAISWSGYAVSLLSEFGIHLPPQLCDAAGVKLIEIPGKGWQQATDILLGHLQKTGLDPATLHTTTAIFNLPAVLIVALVTTLLVIGIRESARFNGVSVVVKLSVIVLFIIGATHAVNTANWHPFIPLNTGIREHFGWTGVMTGAGTVFFAYIGFDAVSTAAQEARNPQRDMPIGIIGSLIICTVLYIIVSAIATGVVPYAELDVKAPIAVVASRAGMGGGKLLIDVGAVAGLSSVILVMMLGQSRVFWAMSKDGLLPPFVSRVHPRFKTPWIITIVTGVCVAFFSAVFTVREAGNLCSIGTLLAFVIVCVSVLVLRVREPHHVRAFRTPWVWVVAPLGVLSALHLMESLPLTTWLRLIIWFAIGMAVYFGYSHRNSKLAHHPPGQP